MLSRELEGQVAALVGGRLSSDQDVLHAYTRDAYPLAIRAAGGLTGLHVAPELVVWPKTVDEVCRLVSFARRTGTALVAYGGGSGIVGGALSLSGGIVVDMKQMNQVEELDEISLTVSVGAGVLGGELERWLNGRGYTCGHYPQSIWSSTVGGWIAHRGAGVASNKYGKMDDLLVACVVVLPTGDIFRSRQVPTSAAGPDLNRLFLGAEGTLGIVTSGTIKIFQLPECKDHVAYAVSSMADGIDAARRVMQSGLRPATIRLYDSLESLDRFGDYLSADGSCVLLIVDEGIEELVKTNLLLVDRVVADVGGVPLPSSIGDRWMAGRFSTAGICDWLARESGIADTLEVANNYRRLVETYEAICEAVSQVAVPRPVRVYGHCSHFYHTGGNIYFTFYYDAPTAEDVSREYTRIVDAALDACNAVGGTVTHHHGVGLNRASHMERELGTSGLAVVRGIRDLLDPDEIMNPGCKFVGRS
jgi:alkyldihydroxyacetonephosphate synthase